MPQYNCQFCGSPLTVDNYHAVTNQYNNRERHHDKGAGEGGAAAVGGWWCFSGLCRSIKGGEKSGSDIKELALDVSKEGRYERRRTIQFDLDSNYGTSYYINKQAKGQNSSILKPQVLFFCDEIKF